MGCKGVYFTRTYHDVVYHFEPLLVTFQRVLRKLIPEFIIEYDSNYKTMMLNMLHFHESVALCDTLLLLKSCMPPNGFTKLYFSFGTVFKTLRKKTFSKNCDIYDFGWLFLAFQLSTGPKGLY